MGEVSVIKVGDSFEVPLDVKSSVENIESEISSKITDDVKSDSVIYKDSYQSSDAKGCDGTVVSEELARKEVIKSVLPSTVLLNAKGVMADPLTGGMEVVTWIGSGFVVDYQDLDLLGYEPNDGETLIATNYHVASGAFYLRVKTSDGQIFLGKPNILVKDEELDIAILVVDTDEEYLSPAEIGTAEDIEQGDSVLAFGSPLLSEFVVTSGIVNNREYDDQHPIQTDAAINMGNSGGPLVDLSSGHVVGMNTFMLQDANSMAFAFPVWSQFEALRENWVNQNFLWSVQTMEVDEAYPGECLLNGE